MDFLCMESSLYILCETKISVKLSNVILIYMQCVILLK